MELHQRAGLIYSDTLQLSDDKDDEPDTEELEAAFVTLMGWLRRQNDFRPEMMTEKEVQEFVTKHTDILNEATDFAIREQKLNDISVQRLHESNYIFSGIKTFHELHEAFPMLTDANGNIRPFKDFLNDVQKINTTYNSTYLRSEYAFAKSSALMAARWKSFINLDPDRYLLQYRTAADERVRRSHRLLHNITLPVTSKFWDWYFPPNGWGCRCNVVAVRRSTNTVSNEPEAMNLGSQATAGKHQEMFRFNSGKEMATFPAYNAYTISKCSQCQYKGQVKLFAKIPDNELCQACKIVRFMKEQQRIKQETLDRLKEKLVGKLIFENEHFNGGKGIFVKNSITENLRYGELYKAKVDVLDHIEEYLSRKMEYSNRTNMKPEKKPMLKCVHVFNTIYNGKEKNQTGRNIELQFEEFFNGFIKFHFIKFI